MASAQEVGTDDADAAGARSRGRPFTITSPDMSIQERRMALKHNVSEVYKDYEAFWHKCYRSRPEVKEKRAEYARAARARARAGKQAQNNVN